jgi:uncharacterized BrkB/YihY/UPF0761 family membrane protein
MSRGTAGIVLALTIIIAPAVILPMAEGTVKVPGAPLLAFAAFVAAVWLAIACLYRLIRPARRRA